MERAIPKDFICDLKTTETFQYYVFSIAVFSTYAPWWLLDDSSTTKRTLTRITVSGLFVENANTAYSSAGAAHSTHNKIRHAQDRSLHETFCY
jgi:glycerol dehydrogenase-like iron-containing ADH family enzyme